MAEIEACCISGRYIGSGGGTYLSCNEALCITAIQHVSRFCSANVKAAGAGLLPD